METGYVIKGDEGYMIATNAVLGYGESLVGVHVYESTEVAQIMLDITPIPVVDALHLRIVPISIFEGEDDDASCPVCYKPYDE